MTGTVVYDGNRHFKNIKDCLCRFVVPFQGKLFNCFRSPRSSISELKQTISFHIFGCNVDNQNLEVTHIIHSGKHVGRKPYY